MEEAGGPEAAVALAADSEAEGEEDSEAVGRREGGNGSCFPVRGSRVGSVYKHGHKVSPVQSGSIHENFKQI